MTRPNQLPAMPHHNLSIDNVRTVALGFGAPAPAPAPILPIGGMCHSLAAIAGG